VTKERFESGVGGDARRGEDDVCEVATTPCGEMRRQAFERLILGEADLSEKRQRGEIGKVGGGEEIVRGRDARQIGESREDLGQGGQAIAIDDWRKA
jgi:hypothetical protein